MKWKQQSKLVSQCEGGMCECEPFRAHVLSLPSSVQESMAHEQAENEGHAAAGEFEASGSAEWEGIHSDGRVDAFILLQRSHWTLRKGIDLCFRSSIFLILGTINIEEEFAGVPLAPAHSLWTADAEGAVKLRIEEGCSEEPVTVHQMFKTSVEKYGNMFALGSKKNDKWEKITFLEYYQHCRRAAKSFIKV